MEIANKVLEEIKAGRSPEELAKSVTWKDVAGSEFNELLVTALRLKDNQQSYNLLVYLFNVSFGKDLWISTEVLGQAIQHPNMTTLDRQAILPTLRSRLDQIKDQISVKAPTEDKLVKYWLMEATYYAMNGTMLAEIGKKSDALQNFKIAQSIFEQLGMSQKALEYKSISRKLLSSNELKVILPKTSPIRLNVPPPQPLGAMGPAPAQPGEPAAGAKPAGEVSAAGEEKAGSGPATSPTEAALTLPQDTSMPVAGEPAVTPPGENPPSSETQVAVVSATATPAAASAPVESAIEAEGARLPSLARREGSSVAGIYYPLPDVWLEEGRLFILGMEKFKEEETLNLAEQIRQESEILVGIRLEIQMFLSRRSILERDLKWMEKRALALKERIARLESKLAELKDKEAEPKT